jgi:hypothetical protein
MVPKSTDTFGADTGTMQIAKMTITAAITIMAYTR